MQILLRNKGNRQPKVVCVCTYLCVYMQVCMCNYWPHTNVSGTVLNCILFNTKTYSCFRWENWGFGKLRTCRESYHLSLTDLNIRGLY